MNENKQIDLVDAKKFMEVFQISRNTVQKWLAHGCPVHRATHEKHSKVWFDIAEVEAWIRREPIEAIKE